MWQSCLEKPVGDIKLVPGTFSYMCLLFRRASLLNGNTKCPHSCVPASRLRRQTSLFCICRWITLMIYIHSLLCHNSAPRLENTFYQRVNFKKNMTVFKRHCFKWWPLKAGWDTFCMSNYLWITAQENSGEALIIHHLAWCCTNLFSGCKWLRFPPRRPVFVRRYSIIYVQFLKMSLRTLKMNAEKIKIRRENAAASSNQQLEKVASGAPLMICSVFTYSRLRSCCALTRQIKWSQKPLFTF